MPFVLIVVSLASTVWSYNIYALATPEVTRALSGDVFNSASHDRDKKMTKHFCLVSLLKYPLKIVNLCYLRFYRNCFIKTSNVSQVKATTGQKITLSLGLIN
tara:strand:+ start:253 stop:558 length:306 start_codon:yes stop_codon:yes gene_type:complete